MNLVALLLWPVAAGAFLAPGWLFHRRWPCPSPLFGVIAGSIALWSLAAFALDCFGVALTRGGVLQLWIGVLLLAAWVGLRDHYRTDAQPTRLMAWRRADLPWVVCAAVGLGSVLIRGWIDPASGWDTVFRWDWLPREMARGGSLEFYPPVQPRDFESYGWPDGIPPTASLVSAWFYLVLNVTEPAVTVARVTLEALGLGAAGFHLARRLGGTAAGWPAVGLMATSGLLLWGVNMGQETGLMALAVVGMLALLPDSTDTQAAAWAGLAAGLAASTREYGLAFVPLGAALLWCRQAWTGNLIPYLLAAATVAVPWYLRNALLTGNPLYPHSLGGLWPTAPAYEAVMAAIGRYWGWGQPAGSPLVWIQALVAGTGLVATVALAAQRRGTGAVWVTVAAVTALWLWSVGHTAGGHVYSLRVLAPAVALLAVLAGVVVATASTGLRRALIALALLFTVDAARRSWLYPLNAGDPFWHYTWAPWADVRDLSQITASPVEPLLTAADGRLLAVDEMALQRQLAEAGGRATSIFDPRLAVAFVPGDFSAIRQQLTAARVTVLVLSAADPVQAEVYGQAEFFRELRTRFVPRLVTDGREVYDLGQLTPRHP